MSRCDDGISPLSRLVGQTRATARIPATSRGRNTVFGIYADLEDDETGLSSRFDLRLTGDHAAGHTLVSPQNRCLRGGLHIKQTTNQLRN